MTAPEWAVEKAARALDFAGKWDETWWFAKHLHDTRTMGERREAYRDELRRQARAALDAVWPETTAEWGVAHAQGFVHEDLGRPFTEARARERAAESVARDARRRVAFRGKTRLMRREVTEWREVQP